MAEEKTSDSDALMKKAREAFQRAQDAENDNRQRGVEDLKFARNGEQWPENIRKQREIEGRPCLTINRMPSFIRQVVNDARQNKPSIKAHPVDSKADPETAEVINGLVRNIEQVSSADIAYDTAIECAVTNGFGYIRVGLDYAFDDSFDMDIKIERVANPFSVYGDPNGTSADGSDWNVAFVAERLTKEEFEDAYGDKAKVGWENIAWGNIEQPWHDGETILIAEWWTREEVEREVVQLEDGTVVAAEDLTKDEHLANLVENGVIQIKARRLTKSHKVTQRIISGLEVLEENEWPGKFIPIAPVYGDEYDVEGIRHVRSLIHFAKDAQMMFNFWRTTSTELVALAPRTPFVGPAGAFSTDAEKWQTVNTISHPYIEYDVDTENGQPPQRQPLDSGVAAGALQEAMNASDDMKSIIGLFDASLGARSNETSGRAIMARQREGDVATFHFMDNLARAIRHVGRIIIDLIPHVYDAPRIIRTVGEDGTEGSARINQPIPQRRPIMGPNGQPMMAPDGQPLMETITRIHDLTIGKYDLTVSTGPSFTSRREEAANSMVEFARAFPPAAPIVMDLVAKNMDWPGADELSKRLKALLPPPAQGGPPPQVQQMMQQFKEAQQHIQKLEQENAKLKGDMRVKLGELQNSLRETDIKAYEAETNRYEAVTDAQQGWVQQQRPIEPRQSPGNAT